ncbi:hypothetical protein SARC_14026, partial [Sphaeroforma arctica JP610]
LQVGHFLRRTFKAIEYGISNEASSAYSLNANQIHGLLRQIRAFALHYLHPCGTTVDDRGRNGTAVDSEFASAMLARRVQNIADVFSHTDRRLVLSVVSSLVNGCRTLSSLANPAESGLLSNSALRGGAHSLGAAYLDVVLVVSECRRYVECMKAGNGPQSGYAYLDKAVILESIDDLLRTLAPQTERCLNSDLSTETPPVMLSSYWARAAEVCLRAMHGHDEPQSTHTDTLLRLLKHQDEHVALSALAFVVDHADFCMHPGRTSGSDDPSGSDDLVVCIKLSAASLKATSRVERAI